MSITFPTAWASRRSGVSPTLDLMYAHIDMTVLTLPAIDARMDGLRFGAAFDRAAADQRKF